jgi:ring-1,2-phenylacetyl-CoA epoxidase subunit PaaC
MARQFLFSNWQELLFDKLRASSEQRIAAVAAKAVKEVAYHARVASEWMVRLGDGTEESRGRTIAGLDWMWRFTDELFQMDDVDAALLDGGVSIDKSLLRAPWDERIGRVLSEATLETPASRRPVLGGRAGRHTEHLGHLLAEMQFLPRAYPDAEW